jgi:hypothetical protein
MMDQNSMRKRFLFGDGRRANRGPLDTPNQGETFETESMDPQLAVHPRGPLQGYPTLIQQYLLQQQTAMAASSMDLRFADRTVGGTFGFVPGQSNVMPQNTSFLQPNNFLDSNNMRLLELMQQKHLQQDSFPTRNSGPYIGNMSGEGDPYAENGILGPWSASSAGLLGNMAATIATEGKSKNTRKKPKDRPKRPLSAYNFFFKEERQRILEDLPEGEEKEQPSSSCDKNEQDGGTRKRKKRPHGKIGFESLAKMIGQRWQELEPEGVEYYKKKADADTQRYKEEMKVYSTKCKTEESVLTESDEIIQIEEASPSIEDLEQSSKYRRI